MLKGSFRTNGAGIGAIVIAIGGIITGLTDSDPKTPDWTASIAAIIAGVGLLAARDNKVSSEEVGAK